MSLNCVRAFVSVDAVGGMLSPAGRSGKLAHDFAEFLIGDEPALTRGAALYLRLP